MIRTNERYCSRRRWGALR